MKYMIPTESNQSKLSTASAQQIQ
uniref:Uncharacterized protein n=1 Tax=Zea mays TaxID=4577 RepID=C4J7W3_MAIZE|nr:unknown [Zea mays]